MVDGLLVKVALWDESVVAWDMRRHLSCAHSQVADCVSLVDSVFRQKVARVMSIWTVAVQILRSVI